MLISQGGPISTDNSTIQKKSKHQSIKYENEFQNKSIAIAMKPLDKKDENS